MGSLILAAFVGAGTARADTVAINFTGFGGGGFNYTQGSYLMGFAFRANSAITITQLGFYDSNSNGQTQTFQNAMVGVYDITTNTLLGSADVTASAPLTGLFRYVSLTNPITLNTTDEYAVVGVSSGNYYTANVPASSASVQVNSAINYLSPAYLSSNGFTTSIVLAEPGFFPTGNIFADFGPDFQFTTAPTVPAGTVPTLSEWGIGLLAVLLLGAAALLLQRGPHSRQAE